MAKRSADLRQAMLSGARPSSATRNAGAVEPPAELAATTESRRLHFRPGREGKSNVTGYFPPEVKKQLRLLAAEHETTIQNLLAEALNDERRSQNRPQSGDAKPFTGGAKLDRPGGPRSIPEVFCGTPEGCIKWSYTLKYGAVSSSRG